MNNYTFDNLARITQVQQNSQTGGNAVAAKRVDFAYDAASQSSTIKRYANLAGTQRVVTSTYTFDNGAGLGRDWGRTLNDKRRIRQRRGVRLLFG